MIPPVCVRMLARARDQNLQFVRLDQFLSSYKGQWLHTWHTSGKDQQKSVNHT